VTSTGATRRLVRGNRGRAQSLRQTKPRKEQPADQPGGQGMRGQPGSAARTKKVGNLTAEPELRYTATGTAITRFTVASNDRKFDPILGQWRDTPTLFTRCIARGAQAEHAAATLHRGHRVVVLGRFRPGPQTTRGGRRTSTVELIVDEVALSLRYTDPTVRRSSPISTHMPNQRLQLLPPSKGRALTNEGRE
jgi:single-strand DNA-binding protein